MTVGRPELRTGPGVLPPAPTRTLLTGVDVLDLGRVRRGMALAGVVYEHHLCSPAERVRLAPDEAHETGLAARLAVKECVVKAMGGRPPGFTWHDVQVVPCVAASTGGTLSESPRQGRDAVAPQVEALADALGRATGLVVHRRASIHVTGASAVALADLLGRAPGEVGAGAAWGAQGDVVIAVAVVHARRAGTEPRRPPLPRCRSGPPARSHSTTREPGGTA